MKAFLSMTFLPQKRTYENTEYNLFVTLRNECLEEKIIEQRITAGEYEERSD